VTIIRKKKQSTEQQSRTITRAAIYLRVSTDDQAQNGYGLDVQREKCRAMALVKGWDVANIHIFTDEGISGTLDPSERPALAALLAAAENGEIGAVIVLALDRLGRKTRLVLDLVEQLTNAGVTVVSTKEGLDTSTPQGQFVLTMFAALAQLERDTIVERTSAGREQRGKIDGEKGGRLPFGYVRRAAEIAIKRPASIDVDDRAALIVRRIFALRDQGLSLRKIAAQLTADQVPTPRGAQEWSAMGVREILQNEAAYKGGARNGSRCCWPTIL
jgi:site-specific DNA recombinase